ncbi:hypothetical protein [Aquimarina algicola]|uniref:Lipoprotein n=1 Tax=Aquimarina algicola TaxID=2589995 RepID=A0A504J404_9FLAO|nr:hypothetical protein [Aquimarina algicola]TPN82313.1 hypothetical protein FHK87_23095 [Aquimarina algicola]
MMKTKNVGYLGFLFAVIILLSSCQKENKSIDIFSYQTKNKEEKFNLLKKYLKKDSGLLDAEYHIWYQDNETGIIPGPSDYTITLALMIKKDSIDTWVKNLEKSSEKAPLQHWEALKLDKTKWKLSSPPEVYFSDTMTEIKILFREENIILGMYSTLPISL